MASTLKIGITAEDQGFKQNLTQMASAASAFSREIGASGKGVQSLNGSFRTAKKAVMDLALAYNQLSAEAKQSDFGVQLKAQLDMAKDAASQLQDLKGDISEQIKNMASDTAGWDAASQGIGVLSSGMQGLAGVVGMCGGNVESFTRALTVMNTIQAVTNTVIGIGNALQSQSALMTGLRDLRTKLLSGSLMKNTAAQAANTTATGAATVSQLALNAAVLANPYVLAAAAIAALCAGIYLWVDANNDVTEAERLKGEAMASVAEQMDKQSDKLATQISSLRILQHEFQNADGDLNKMKSSMSNFDEVCKNANVNLYDQATAEQVLGNLAPVMVKKYNAEAKAAAFAAAIQSEYGRIIAKVADIQKRLAEGKTIDVGDLEELNLKVDYSSLNKLGLAHEHGVDDLVASWLQPSAQDLKLAAGVTAEQVADAVLDAAKKAFENGPKMDFFTKGLGESYAELNDALKEFKDNGIDTNKLFNNNTMKKAMTAGSKSVKNSSKEMNTLLSTIKGCDNVIRKAEDDLKELDHKSGDFAQKFTSLNAVILGAKKSKLELIDRRTLTGLNEAKTLAEDILQYLEPESDEYKEINDEISKLNESIYDYLEKMSKSGSEKALKDCKSEIEKILQTQRVGSEEWLVWINRLKDITAQSDELERILNNRIRGIEDNSSTEIKQRLDKAIQDLADYTSNTHVDPFGDPEKYAKYLDTQDKMIAKAKELAKLYSTQKMAQNGVEVKDIKPIDLTFSYKTSNIDKINEEIRYLSEKQKIMKEFDIKIDDTTTFNIYQDEIDETTKKINELKKAAKLDEILDDIKNYKKEIANMGYDSIKNGVQGLGQMYDSVSGLIEKLDECKNPLEGIFAVFDTVFGIVDTIKSFVEGIDELLQIIQTLTTAKEALNAVEATGAAIRTEEAIATTTQTAAEGVNAGEAAGIVAVEETKAAALKTSAAAAIEAAAAQIFMAHSYIPFAGPGIAAGLVGMMQGIMAGVQAQATALQAFAEGGIVEGSTTMGDSILVRANRGEMILNNRQQSKLFDMINNGNVSGSNVNVTGDIKVRGSDLLLALRNNKKITGKTL